MHEIDDYVAGRLRALGADAALQAETVRVAAEVRQARLKELRSAKDVACADVSRLKAELEGLAALPEEAHTPERRVDLEAVLGKAVDRVERAKAEMAALRKARLDPEKLRTALGAFVPVWTELFPTERRRVLGLLLERIEYHAPRGELTLHYNDAGLALLADEAQEGEP